VRNGRALAPVMLCLVPLVCKLLLNKSSHNLVHVSGLDDRGIIQLLARTADFYGLQGAQTVFGTHPTSYLMRTGDSFPRGEADRA